MITEADLKTAVYVLEEQQKEARKTAENLDVVAKYLKTEMKRRGLTV